MHPGDIRSHAAAHAQRRRRGCRQAATRTGVCAVWQHVLQQAPGETGGCAESVQPAVHREGRLWRGRRQLERRAGGPFVLTARRERSQHVCQLLHGAASWQQGHVRTSVWHHKCRQAQAPPGRSPSAADGTGCCSATLLPCVGWPHLRWEGWPLARAAPYVSSICSILGTAPVLCRCSIGSEQFSNVNPSWSCAVSDRRRFVIAELMTAGLAERTRRARSCAKRGQRCCRSLNQRGPVRSQWQRRRRRQRRAAATVTSNAAQTHDCLCNFQPAAVAGDAARLPR